MNIELHEFLDRKSEKTKYSDGKNELAIHSKDIAYKDTEDKFQPIDTTPIENEDNFTNSANSIKPTILKNPKKPYNVLYSTDYGLDVYFDLRNFKYVNEAENIEDIIATPEEANNYLKKNNNGVDTIIQSVINHNIVDSFEIFKGRIKRNIYLEKKPTPSEIEHNLFKITHKVKTNKSVNILINDEIITKKVKTSEDILLKCDDSEEYFVIEKPYIEDKDGNSYPVEYEIENITETEFDLNFIFNSGILNEANYPLIIDPSSTISPKEGGEQEVSADFTLDYSQEVEWEAELYNGGWSGPTEEYFINGEFMAKNDTGEKGYETYTGKLNLSSGTHTHTLEATGVSGMPEGVTAIITWGSDSEPPSISVDNTGSDWTNNDQSVTINASDVESGVDGIYYDWNHAPDSANSWNSISNGSATTQSNDGEWYLHVKAEDGAGNTNINHYGPYKIDKTYPDNPNVQVGEVTTSTISLNWDVNDSGGSGVDYVRLHFQKSNSDGDLVEKIDIDGDGLTEHSIDVETSSSYTIEDLEVNQYYRYQVRVFDNAGNIISDGYYTVKTNAKKQITIGGSDVQDITIDDEIVKEVTIDGEVVFKK